MKKIGMFLGFQSDDNLSIHGIGRLLAFILKESDIKKKEIVLFCPEWLNDSLYKLLNDNKINAKDFEIVTTNRIPIGVKVKKFISNRSKRNKYEKRSVFSMFIKSIKNNIGNFLKKVISDFFSTSSYMLLFFKALIYIVIGTLSLPFFILFIVAYSLTVVTKKILNRLRAFNILRFFERKIRTLISSSKFIIYQRVIDEELKKMVKLVNKRKDISVCYIPSMAWPQIAKLSCNKVLAAPDIVFYDFPTQFLGVTEIHKKIRTSIACADHLICYSDYVKNEHLIKNSGINPDKITVIKHANVKMDEHLKISESIQNYISSAENSIQIINKYFASSYHPGHVLYDCNIEDLDYVIYSSQYRPHKNISNLFKAIKIINFDFNRNIKLIVTANIDEVDYLKDYIKDNYLENDILVMHNIKSELLAALNQMARTSVNPTLFEGGFPFTFSEAYSVGTPSVMSDIPVVSSEISQFNLKDSMLFDPLNPRAIAEKIIWAVDNRERLFNEQANLYWDFDNRDWKKVVNEYNQVFRKFIS